MSAVEDLNGPPRLNAAKVARGDVYASKPALTQAVTRIMLADGRRVKSGNGGSRQAVYRCQGQVLDDSNKDVGSCSD